MIVIGIDPGITGAIAWHDGKRWRVTDTPVLEVRKGRKVMNVAVAIQVIGASRVPYPHVFVETQQPMPKQGVSSMFSIGRNFGQWEGLLTALGWPTTYVSPRVWKREMGLIGKEKDASRKRALELFPCLAEDLKLKKHHGRADAVLIGEWGRRQ